jgi:hypothetical protein
MTEYKPDEGMDIVFSEDTDQAPKIHRDKDHNNHKYQCVLCSSTLPMPYIYAPEALGIGSSCASGSVKSATTSKLKKTC